MKLTKNKFVHYTVVLHLVMTSSFGFAEGTLSSANFNTGETNNTRTAKTTQELQKQVAERAKQSAQQSMNLVAAAEAQKKASKKKMIIFGAIGVGLGVMAGMDWVSCLNPVDNLSGGVASDAAKSTAAEQAASQSVTQATAGTSLNLSIAPATVSSTGTITAGATSSTAATGAGSWGAEIVGSTPTSTAAAGSAGAGAASAVAPMLGFAKFRQMFGHPCVLAVTETAGALMALKASLDAKKDIKRAKESIEAAKAANFKGEGGTAYGDTRTGEYADDSSAREGDAPTLAAMEFQRNAETKAIKALNSIAKKTKGKISINPNKGTMTVAGKEYKLPEFDKKSLMAAGATSAQVDSAMSQIDSIASKVTKNLEQSPQLASIMNDSSGGDDFGGGGGGGFASMMQNQTEQQQMAGLDSSGSRIPSSATGASSLDGMSKNYNGEPIGVAQDELFGMMTRRYKAVENLNHFMQ